MKGRRGSIGSCLLGVIFCASPFLLPFPLDAQSQAVRAYTEDDGLPSSVAYGIHQADDGHLWLTTRGGLSVYDGRTWRTMPAPEGMSFGGFDHLASDDRGDIWAVSSTGHLILVRWDGERWHHYPVHNADDPSDEEPSALAVHDVNGRVQVALGTTSGGLLLRKEGSWRRLRDEGNWPTEPVFALAATDEALYAASGTAVLELRGEESRWLPGLDAAPDPANRGPAIRGLATDTRRGEPRLWIVGRDWVGHLDPRAGDEELVVLNRDLPRLSDTPGWVLAESDGSGGLYIADRSQILHVDGDGVLDPIDRTWGLPSAGARGLEVDREGLLWLASGRGVTKLASRRFSNLDRLRGLLEDEVTAVLETGGRFYLGHNRGLSILDPGGRIRHLRFDDETGRPDSVWRVMDLEAGWDRGQGPGQGPGQDPVSPIWVATSRAGLLRLLPGDDPATDERTWLGPENGLPHQLCCVVETPEGLWAAGTRSGPAALYFLDRQWLESPGAGPLPFEPVELEPSPSMIRRMVTDAEGTLYVLGRHSGVYVRPAGGLEEWRWLRAPPKSDLYALLATADGQVWAGGLRGLLRAVDGRLRPAPELPELGRAVYALMEEPPREPGGEPRLWIGTENGVYRWSDTEGLRHYGIREGLAGRETNRDSLATDTEGRVWVGTNLGVSRYRERYDGPPPVPEVELEGLETTEGYQDFDGSPIRLPATSNLLVFDFFAPSYTNEEALEFAAHLVGLDPDFLPASRSPDRQLRYSHVPPGTYYLRLRARLPGGNWGPAARSPEITIAHPLWRQGWFLTGMALLALALVGTGFSALASRSYSRLLRRQVSERTGELESSNERLAKAAAQLRQEVAERRRTEAELRAAKVRAEAANRAKSRFLATMSHEIRTPMNGVLGMISILEQGELGQEQRQRVEILRQSGQALLALLDDILDYSKIEAGKLEIEAFPYDPRRLLDEVVALFSPRAAEKGLELRARVDDDLPAALSGDASRLRQVMVNLVGNAVKFTDRGQVEVSLGWQGDDPGRLRITVRDTGIGIPEDRLEALFRPFQQVDSSIRRRFGGTGLGLAICERIVSAMGGRLEAESRVAEGSTFTADLPMARAASLGLEALLDAAVDSPQAGAAGPIGSANNRSKGQDGPPLGRILVAEDNPINQLIATELLRGLGYEPRVAENGLQVLDALEGAPTSGEGGFDLVLMDVQMPELDGLETTRQVIERWGARRPPIVAMTAHALRGDREACLEAGMDDYLSKPVSRQVLAEKLAHWVGSRREPREQEVPGPKRT